jgi:general secretion pathway protein C
VLFAALCGVATYWGLQLFAPRMAIAPAGSLVDWQKAPDLAAASRLFGMPASAVQSRRAAAAASNIKVIGVAASSQRGSAILSIDGKPPKAFMVGDKIDDHAMLVEVRPDVVIVEQAGGRVELPTPDRPDPALLSAGPAAGASASSAAAPVPAAPRLPPVPPRPVPPAAAPPPVAAPALPPAAPPLPATSAGTEPPAAQPPAELQQPANGNPAAQPVGADTPAGTPETAQPAPAGVRQ